MAGGRSVTPAAPRARCRPARMILGGFLLSLVLVRGRHAGDDRRRGPRSAKPYRPIRPLVTGAVQVDGAGAQHSRVAVLADTASA